MKIPFNKPFLTGKETHYIYQAVLSGKISGNGMFTGKCHDFFKEKYSIKKSLLTTSCTDALEMAALLANINQGDEVILPSFTFVSTANAFALRGAKLVFCDSGTSDPNINVKKIEALITPKTKAIVPVHYAGMACDMDKILELAASQNIMVVEDAAQAIDSYYKGKPLGTIGHFGAFSFHETKNIIAGEGGLLSINDEQYFERAEIIWEKGTNRAKFFRGEVNKYGWVDLGSSFLPSEIISAFLFAQLENIENIQTRRKEIWDFYFNSLKELEKKEYLKLPAIPAYATNNGHMFYVLCRSLDERTGLIEYLKSKGILSVFHYISLHKSDYYSKLHGDRELPMSDYYTDHLLRLPMYYELSDSDLSYIVEQIYSYWKGK